MIFETFNEFRRGMRDVERDRERRLQAEINARIDARLNELFDVIFGAAIPESRTSAPGIRSTR